MSDVSTRGRGIPNIVLEKDYSSSEGWCLRVETIVPNVDEASVRAWLENGRAGTDVLEQIIASVPNGGARADAQHMVAAAFGYELDESNDLTGRRSHAAA